MNCKEYGKRLEEGKSLIEYRKRRLDSENKEVADEYLVLAIS